MRGAILFPCFAFCSALSVPADAVDRFGLELGQSFPQAVKVARIEIDWDWQREWRLGTNWRATGYWEAGIAFWDNEHRSAKRPDIWDVSLTPVLRLYPAWQSQWDWYVESGVGAHLISEKQVTEQRQLGGHFQFGSHVGIGVVFGPNRDYDVGLRLQHLSNAGLRSRNDGINFATLRLAHAW